MRRQIVRLSVGQTSKVFAVMYGLMGLVFLPIIYVASMFAPGEEASRIGLGIGIAIPLVYALIGFVFTAIACAIYNVVAKFVGGIEAEVETPGAPAL